MSIRKASSRTTVNSGVTAAAAATVNLITTAPATATTVAGGGTLGGVTISNISIMSNSFVNAAVLSGDTAVSSSGGFVRITGTGFKTNANVFLGATLCSNTFVSSTQINANIPASSSGTYQFYVFNTDGSGAAFTSGLVVSGPPTWTTTSYTASALNIGAIQLLASGDAPLTYYIQPGSSNPQNLVVNSAGYLSGTVASEGAYTITVIVDDAQNQSAQADITLTVTLSEPYFKQTTLLLSGDGTNNANNISFVDSSSNTLTITRNGGNPGMSQGTFTPFSQTGWSGYFTGATTSYIATPTTSILNQGQTYTVQCWIYPTSFTTSTSAVRRMYIFIFGVIYAGLSIHSDGTLGWYGWPTPAGMIVTSAAGTITTNEWQHVALVINPSGNSIKLFKNGVEVGSAAYTAAGANNSAIQIGHGDTSQATDGFIGYISNFKVTLSALTGAQLDYSATPTISSPTGSALLVLQTNRFNDTSANAFSITNGGVTSIQAFSPFAPAAQYSTSTNGGSGYFDGTGDFLSFANNAVLNPGTDDFVMEAWVYITALTGNNQGFNGKGTAGVEGYSFYMTNARVLSFVWNGTGGATITGGTLNLNQWHHVAVVRNNNVIRLYLDGTGAGSSTACTTDITSTATKYVGQARGGNPVLGYMSNYRMMKGSRPATYDATSSSLTVPTAPLTSVPNTALLLNFTNAGIIDATGKNVVETVADAKISTDQSKFGGSSIAFDGTGDYLTIPSSQNFNFSTGDFTVEFWYRTAATGTHTIIDNNYATAPNFTVQPISGSMKLYVNGSATVLTESSTHSANVWYHYAFVRSGSTITMYRDGTSVASATYSGAVGNGSVPIYIGGSLGGGGYYVNGYIDDLRVTKGFARYTANFTAPTSNHKLR